MESSKLKPQGPGVQGRGKPPAHSKPKGKGRKGRKPQAARKEDALAKELPKIANEIGDKESNKQANIVSKLVAAGQISSMSGTSSTFSVVDFLAASQVYAVAIDLVHKLCVTRPCDAGSVDSASSWTPAGALCYLVWALFDALRKAGAFQNPAMVNAFPPFPADGDIPVAWAQVLSYIQPFRQGSVTCAFDDNTLTALPTPPTNARVGLGATNFALGGRTVSCYYPLGVGGSENGINNGTGPTWAAIYTAQPYLSNIWSSLSCTKYANIPDVAPDASAYAVPAPQAGGGFVCVSPSFNPEVTAVLGISGATGQAYGNQSLYYKPTPALNGQATAQFWFIENFQLCPFIPGANARKTLMKHAWNDAAFCDRVSPSGRVVVSTRKDRQPIRFLFGNTMPTDTRALQSLIGQVLAVMNPNGNYTAAQVYAVGVCVMSAVIAKLIPYCYATSQSAGSLCTAYDPAFANMAMPPALAAIINTLGPLAMDGRMWYPHLWQSTDNRGNWIAWSTVGLVSYTGVLYRYIVGGVDTNGITIGNFVLTAANFATTANFPMTPVTSTPAFMTVFTNVFNGGTSAGENVANLIKLDSHNPVGKANQLVMADVNISGAQTSAANYPTIATTPTILRVNELQVSNVGSYKCIMGDELGAGCVCPVAAPMNNVGAISTIALVNPPFRAPVGGLNRMSGISMFAMNCMTQEVGEAMAMALGSMKRQAVAVNGNTVDVSSNGDLFGAIVDKLVAPIFGDGVAQGIKGSPLAGPMRHALPWVVPGGGAVLYGMDRLGVVDGVLSTFANSKQRKEKPPTEYAKSDLAKWVLGKI